MSKNIKKYQKFEFLTKFRFKISKKIVSKTRNFDQKNVDKKVSKTRNFGKKNVPKTRIFDQILF